MIRGEIHSTAISPATRRDLSILDKDPVTTKHINEVSRRRPAKQRSAALLWFYTAEPNHDIGKETCELR